MYYLRSIVEDDVGFPIFGMLLLYSVLLPLP